MHVSQPCPRQQAVRELKRHFASWKKANDNEPYIEVRDVYGAEVGGGMEGAGGDNKQKKVTKQVFTDPMDKLASYLKTLHAALRGRDCDLATRTLEKDVTSKFKTIVDIVNLTDSPSTKLTITKMTASATMRDLALNLPETVMTGQRKRQQQQN